MIGEPGRQRDMAGRITATAPQDLNLFTHPTHYGIVDAILDRTVVQQEGVGDALEAVQCLVPIPGRDGRIPVVLEDRDEEVHGIGIVEQPEEDGLLDLEVGVRILDGVRPRYEKHHGVDVADEFRERFLREAQILSQLDHPSVCKIHDFIEGEDNDFLVLESIEGHNLRRAMSSGLDLKTGLRVADRSPTTSRRSSD